MKNIIGHAMRAAFACGSLALALLAPATAFGLDKLHLLVPANPGGGWDQTGHAMRQAMLAGKAARDIRIENKGGVAGTIGLLHFAQNAKGDPNALMIGGSVMVGGILLNKSPVNLTQLTPIARLTGEYNILVVSADSPIRSVKHLVKRFKEDPESVVWGGGSAGGTDHLIVGMIAQALGVDVRRIRYVPFSGGGDAQNAIVNGEVTVGLSGWSEFANGIVAGKMRPIAITSEKRMIGLRMPTLKENGIDVVMANWRAVFAPAGITETQKKALTDAVRTAAEGDAWRDILLKNQWTDLYLEGDAFRDYLMAEQQRTEKVMKLLGLIR